MSVRRTLFGILSASLVMAALSGDARADGVAIPAARLPAAARTALLTEIDAARKAQPSAFAALATVRTALPELDAQKRGPLASVTPQLRSIGNDGLFPMLAELAVEALPRGDLTDTAWLAWRIALLEAVGSIRDPRAEATLTAIVDGPETDFAVMKAAVEALGKVASDTAVARLIALSKTAGPKQKAAFAGMGECRRAKVAQALSQLVGARPGEASAKLLIRSLGNVGSAWAWKTPAVAVSGEEAAVRSTAAKALIGAYVAYEGALRHGAGDAILVVDDPSTPTLIEAAKKANPALTADLDNLAQRYANSPLH